MQSRKLVPLAMLGICVSSCDYRSSVEPAGVRRAPTGALFANAVTSAVSIVRSDLEISTFTLWPQHVAQISGAGEDRYRVNAANVDAAWRALYSGPLEDIEQALRQARDDNQPRQIGSLFVLRAWTYDYVSGIWGDVPFSEASRGDLGRLAPAYDKQADIYSALLTNVSDAATFMNASGDAFGKDDPIYGGDATKWKRFANSLRARLGLQLSKADPTRAKGEVSAAVAAGGFTSNADNAVLAWPGDGTNDNPWARHQRAADDLRVSKALVDTLKALSDPRLVVFAQKATLTDQFAGAPNGLDAVAGAAAADVSSRIGVAPAKKDAPSYLMTYAEYLFIEAEAAERGWISGSAKQFYEDAIRASLEQWGVAKADADAYLAQPSVQYVAGSTGLAQIGLQKWIALFTEGLDAWSEWRRTGFPALTPVADAATNPAAIPRRLPYASVELSTNGAHVQAAISAQGGAGLTDRMWIDK
jgi:hypothetical protein